MDNLPAMSQDQMGKLMQHVFNECWELRQKGQAEYAHDQSDAHANFKRTALDLGLEPEQVLWIFANKHRDGITAWINGHKSQREDVRGRINDLIVYLVLLRGFVELRDLGKLSSEMQMQQSVERRFQKNPAHANPYYNEPQQDSDVNPLQPYVELEAMADEPAPPTFEDEIGEI